MNLFNTWMHLDPAEEGCSRPHLAQAVLQLFHLLFHLLLLRLQPLHQLQLLLAPVVLTDLQLPRELHDGTVGLGQEVLLLLALPLQRRLPVGPCPLPRPFPSLQLHLQKEEQTGAYPCEPFLSSRLPSPWVCQGAGVRDLLTR